MFVNLRDMDEDFQKLFYFIKSIPINKKSSLYQSEKENELSERYNLFNKEIDLELLIGYSDDKIIPDFDFLNLLKEVFPDDDILECLVFFQDLLVMVHILTQHLWNPIYSLNSSARTKFAIEEVKDFDDKGSSINEKKKKIILTDDYVPNNSIDRIDEMILLARAIEMKGLTVRFSNSELIKDGSKPFALKYNVNESLVSELALKVYDEWLLNNKMRPCNDDNESKRIEKEVNFDHATYQSYLFLLIHEGIPPSFTTEYLQELKRVAMGYQLEGRVPAINLFLKFTAEMMINYINKNTSRDFLEQDKFKLIYTAFVLNGLLNHKFDFRDSDGFDEKKRLFVRDLLRD